MWLQIPSHIRLSFPAWRHRTFHYSSTPLRFPALSSLLVHDIVVAILVRCLKHCLLLLSVDMVVQRRNVLLLALLPAFVGVSLLDSTLLSPTDMVGGGGLTTCNIMLLLYLFVMRVHN